MAKRVAMCLIAFLLLSFLLGACGDNPPSAAISNSADVSYSPEIHLDSTTRAPTTAAETTSTITTFSRTPMVSGTTEPTSPATTSLPSGVTTAPVTTSLISPRPDAPTACQPDTNSASANSFLGLICSTAPKIGITNEARAIAFSHDQKYFATVTGLNNDWLISVWLVGSYQLVKTIKTTVYRYHEANLKFSADNKSIALLSGSQFGIWEIATGNLKTLIISSDSNERWSVSNDFKLLASYKSSGRDTKFSLWEIATGKEIQTVEANSGYLYGAAISPNGKVIATSGRDDTVLLWEVPSLKKVAELKGKKEAAKLEFSSNNKYLLVGTYSQGMVVWEIASGKQILNNDGSAPSASFSIDEQSIAFTEASSVMVVNIASGKQTALLERGNPGVRATVFSPDNQFVLVIQDSNINLWNLAQSQRILNLPRQFGSLTSAALNADGKFLATTVTGSRIQLWDTTTNGLPIPKYTLLFDSGFSAADSSALSLGFNDNLKTLVTADKVLRTGIRYWSLEAKLQLFRLELKDSADIAFKTVSFSSDGQYAALGSYTGELALSRIANQSAAKILRKSPQIDTRQLDSHQNAVNLVQFSRDNQKLAAADVTGKIWVWDVASQREQFAYTAPKVNTNYLTFAFSRDNKILAAANADGTLQLFDLTTGKEIGTLTEPAGAVRFLHFTPDGKTLLSLSDSGVATKWDLGTKKATASVKVFDPAGLLSVSLSGDERYLVTVHGDNSFKLWELKF
jgi:WD40 repeat protein